MRYSCSCVCGCSALRYCGSVMSGRSVATRLLVFEGDKTHPGRHRRVVVPMNAARLRRYGAAHGEPHDELDGFRPGLLHDFLVRDPRQPFRISLELVEEPPVELLVHVAETLALELVRHPAGAH